MSASNPHYATSQTQDFEQPMLRRMTSKVKPSARNSSIWAIDSKTAPRSINAAADEPAHGRKICADRRYRYGCDCNFARPCIHGDWNGPPATSWLA